ncbi:MAG: hypothetical protein HXY40_10235 [Chloroflexi bacterium]|nr:hypothetical protein [Chloroflexota bacterium]
MLSHPWNPLHQCRMLWWLLAAPQRFLAYSARCDPEQLRSAGAWLASTLAWSPLFFAVIGYLGESTRHDAEKVTAFIALPLAWLITGLLGGNDNVLAITASSFVGYLSIFAVVSEMPLFAAVLITYTAVCGVAVCLAFGLRFGFAYGTTCAISAFIGFGIAFGALGIATVVLAVLLAFGIAAVMEANVRAQRASLVSRLSLGLLTLSYIVLIWLYVLGGWRVFTV